MNQTKKILVYLGCIAFTILGVWLLTIDDTSTMYSLWKLRVAGILTIIFFGGGGLFMAYKKVKLLINHKKDPEKVIANESSWIKRKTMEYNLKTINALYSFPAYMMDGRADEALALCKQKLAKHK